MKKFFLYFTVTMVSFGMMLFSIESFVIAEPLVSFIDGSNTWEAGFTSSCPEGCNYVSDTDDPLGPWSGQSVHFRGLDWEGQELVYRYKLEFDQDVEIDSIAISGAAWDQLRLLDGNMNELKLFDLPGGNELHTYTIHTYGAVDEVYYIEEINNGYTYFIYRSNIELNFSQPCASEAEIILNGKDFSDISGLWDGTNYGWQIEEPAIITWWSEESIGTDIWVEYEAYLTEGNWKIGLCAINHSHLGHDGLGTDPNWYPQFELSNNLTDDIIIVPASDTSLNYGYFNFEAPEDGNYSVKLRWLNDQAEGTRPDGMPILDANIKIVRVFFDKVQDFLSVDIFPDTLNLKSKGNYVTCYIEINDGYDASDIDTETVVLIIGDTTIEAELSPTEVGDYNYNGVPDLMVKFDRQSIQDACASDTLEIRVNCETYDGTSLQGTDTVFVIDKGKAHFSEDQGSVIY